MADRLPVTAIVMAGGSGTRFWPASRRARPKQVLDLAGTGQSMIADTVARMRPITDRFLVVGTENLGGILRDALPELPESAFVLEPVGRNTAACIGLAAVHAGRLGPAVLVVLPSDHYVADVAAFRGGVETAVRAAMDGAIVMLGIRPTRPETGFGYLEVDDEVSPGTRRLARFVEKPDTARAAEFLAGGRHLWNSGIFIFRTDAILDAIGRHLPDLSHGLDQLGQALDRSTSEERAARAALYATLPSISIDYGVMEKLAGALVVPCDCGWSDVGSFAATWELARRDDAGNAGVAVHVDAARNFAWAPAGKLVAMLGVSDLVVVDTGDVLLVLPRDRAQDVRAIVAALEREGRTDVL